MTAARSRRDLLTALPAAALAAGAVPMSSFAGGQPPGEKKPTLWPGFPRQNAKLVSEVVGTAHFNEARVKELVKAEPALVNAWWDWGFGDWESPLGAASHVGQRGIAEFLLAEGARIDIFAAAMLGMTAVVKAFVAAQPGIQKTLGPHGITLLAHAKAGGKPAADTLAYLESLGDAGTGHKITPLPADRKDVYLGKYASAEADVRIECLTNKSGLLVVDIRHGTADPVGNKIIHYLGEDEFFPSGVPAVRMRFAVEGGKAKAVTVRGNGILLTAGRGGV